MTTDQTIDGVPRLRELLERVADPYRREPRSIHLHNSDIAELRALLDAPVECRCKRYGKDNPHWPCPVHAAPAAQYQGEPVAWTQPNQAGMCISSEVKLHSLKIGGAPAAAVAGYSVPLYAVQPAPVASVPDGYCIMPRQLTAENGAKALLLGEFKLLVTKGCPECCELEEPAEGCSICDGEGEYGQKHTIPWDQIKFIYSKAVSGLAVKAASAKTR